MDTLSHYEALNFGLNVERSIGIGDFLALNEYSENIAWSNWAAELMLRISIEYGFEKRVIGKWVACYANLTSPNDGSDNMAAMLEKIEQEGRFELILGLKELNAINSRGYQLDNLSRGVIRVIFRSMLMKAKDGERDDILYWSRRFMG